MSSTAVASTKDDATIRSVANHMTHNPSTAKAYYQHVHGSKNSLQVYNTLNSVPKVVENPAPTCKKRRLWSDEEEDILRVFFQLHQKNKPPSLSVKLYYAMIMQIDLRKGAKKEIQDKCRTIINRN